jgi:predicted glycosyltransferase
MRRIPSFVINDYEHVDLLAYRAAGAYMFFPDVIDAAVYRRAGFPPRRLIPFAGIKEDLTFAELDPTAPPVSFDGEAGVSTVLFRPPAEDSHYFRSESRHLALEVLSRLAADPQRRVVFLPRTPGQAAYLEQVSNWRSEPVLVQHALPPATLIRGVDAVVYSGGTMLREAAYLGVPAVSLLRSEIGAVDRHLASLGRLHIVDSIDAFDALELVRRPHLPVLAGNPRLVDELVGHVLDLTGRPG